MIDRWDNDGWYPTNEFRCVVDKSGGAFIQQLWARGFIGDTVVMNTVDDDVTRSIRREEQWRIIPTVQKEDMTPEELGITRFADWPKPHSPF